MRMRRGEERGRLRSLVGFLFFQIEVEVLESYSRKQRGCVKIGYLVVVGGFQLFEHV